MTARRLTCAAVLSTLLSYRLMTSSPNTTPASAARWDTVRSPATRFSRALPPGNAYGYLAMAECVTPTLGRAKGASWRSGGGQSTRRRKGGERKRRDRSDELHSLVKLRSKKDTLQRHAWSKARLASCCVWYTSQVQV